MTDNFEKDINVPSKEIIITNKRQGKNIYNIIDDKTELTIQSKKFGDITFIVNTHLIDLLKEYPWCVRNFKGNYYAYANNINHLEEPSKYQEYKGIIKDWMDSYEYLTRQYSLSLDGGKLKRPIW